MKRFLALSVCVFTLTACETISSIPVPSMPEWSSLNPFGSESTVQAVDVNEPAPTAPENASALSTEMEEMARLTGTSPRFDNRGIEETAIEEVATEIADIDLPMAPKGTPTPAIKPQISATPQKTKMDEVIEETVTETTDKVIKVADAAPTPTVPTTPMVEKEIAPVIAEPTSALKTSDIPMFNDKDLKVSSTKGCPQVKIMPAGRSITYFENELSGSMVARAVIDVINGGCEVVDGGLEIDLDILMRGKITDKGRFEGRTDREAFMTFPYFVAVTTPEGQPVDKKILATAMRFKPVVNDLDHAEKITQFIPMDTVTNAMNYTITVGFQLNRKQLEYNRARNVNRVNNIRVAPDLKRNPSRLSPNLLAE